MNQVFRCKTGVFILVIVMVIGTSLIAGCMSESASNNSAIPPKTTQSTITPSEPRINAMVLTPDIGRGQDVVFKGDVEGGAKSLTLTIHYVCEMGATNCPTPMSLKGTPNFIDKRVVSINADSSFSSNIGTSAYKTGMYVAFLELPTGQYTSLVFIVDTS